jgi:uncharacterized protein
MSLLLDLSRLRTGTERIERSLDPGAFADTTGDFRVVSPVEFTADVRKDGQKVRATGRVRATLETGCSRCLEPFTLPVDAAFDALFLPASANAGEEEQEVGDEDLGVSFYTRDTIDLGQIIREQFYLAMPMKPLCREDCRGLCPVCGINRNREVCSCQTTWEDPRLEPLKRFKAH